LRAEFHFPAGGPLKAAFGLSGTYETNGHNRKEKKMNIPGFTANASLDTRSNPYVETQRQTTQAGIVPQFCFRQPGSSYSTCVDCVDLDGDGNPDYCWVRRVSGGITLM
jgi:hypothetical protein